MCASSHSAGLGDDHRPNILWHPLFCFVSASRGGACLPQDGCVIGRRAIRSIGRVRLWRTPDYLKLNIRVVLMGQSGQKHFDDRRRLSRTAHDASSSIIHCRYQRPPPLSVSASDPQHQQSGTHHVPAHTLRSRTTKTPAHSPVRAP